MPWSAATIGPDMNRVTTSATSAQQNFLAGVLGVTPNQGAASGVGNPAGALAAAASGAPASPIPGAPEATKRQFSLVTDFVTNQSNPNITDPSIASRGYMNLPSNYAQPLVSASVYSNPNVPAFLAGAVDRINATQLERYSAQQDLINKLFRGVEGGGENAYMLAEALRAAAATPGANINFGSAVTDPRFGKGYQTQSNAFAANLDANTAVTRGALDLQQQIQALRKKRDEAAAKNAGTLSFGPSEAGKIDNQIINLMMQQKGYSSVPRTTSGWTPTMPRF